MTLKSKSIIVAILVLAIVLFSFGLFTEYNALNNSILANHSATQKILRAEDLIYKALTESKPDIETAMKTIEGIPKAAGNIDIKKLTQDEMSDMINVKMSFIRIERLLKGMSGDRKTDEPSIRQINNELLKIENFTEKFMESFRHRREKEVASKVKIQTALLPLVGIGMIVIFMGFYRSFLKPITYLTSQVQAVKDGTISNISVYKGKDEIGRLSDFTYRTLDDLRKSHESEHLITQAVEESGDGVVIANKRGVIEYVNPAFERITGYAETEFIGKNLISRIGQEEFKDNILKNINLGNVWSDTILTKKKDGKEYLEHVSIIPVKNAKGETIKFVSISRDVTKEKSLEEQLRQSQKMEVVGRLAGGIAHDFNNLLTTIIGFANLMSNEIKADDLLKQYAGHILSASEKAANLTQSLLAFSRKQIINPAPADINDIIRRLEKLLLRLIGEDIELKTSLSDGAMTVMADTVQVEQVLMNLATNARDAMPKGGLLTIETKPVIIDSEYAGTHLFAKPGIYACISVTDTGVGMDEKTRKNIFEPFFTTKELGKGTGLGLSIIYGIVKQHDGDINVYSEPGKGTTFKIYFPLIMAASAEKKGGDIAIPPPKGGTETVLVAEDNHEVRYIVKAVLEGGGYTVIEAFDGEDAVKKFIENKDRVQLLLLDVIMPKKNGKEAYDEIKSMRPGIKTVFMSGYTAEIIDRKGMMEAGAELVSKPISPNGLLRKIREVLDR
ncbi:MAG: ATP-binding protein [Nitrospirae bacterium]|nr:ATP-binding protein [Nitrospirota bacterium]